MRNRLLFFVSFVLALFLVPAFAAHADAPRLAGTIEAEIDGRLVQLPLLKADIDVDIAGDLASVSVTQTFANPADQALHATYLFPLNHDAAVHEMWMEVGAERIRAQIQEVQQAEQTFERAKSQGRAAALLKQHRPNLFTQQIANLMPGLPVRVTLRYVQTVPKIDGDYELVLPLVVGPRFQPPGAELPPAPLDEPAPAREGTWTLAALPAYPPVFGLDLPPTIDDARVGLQLRIDGGLPVQLVESRTHAITTQAESATHWSVGLQEGRTIDNRDFVLRYRLAGATTDAGLLVQADDRGGGWFSLLIEPPAAPADTDIMAREMVFLLDCSGSMHGLPMDASKAFMREALRKLRPGDSFRIIRFSDDATEFSEAPLPATADNIRRGLDYTEKLRGEGGTMMARGIRQALEVPAPAGSLRIVTFLTDGYIGNEAEILRMVEELRGGARLYAFGVGTGVNRHLLDELGRAGRGFTRYMDPTEDLERVAADLSERLQSPVLTDIAIDWNGLQVADVVPAIIPDLFAGQSLRIQGRYLKPGRGPIHIHGRSRGRAATLMLPVELPEHAQETPVARLWARAAIKDAMTRMTLPPLYFEARGEPVPDFDMLKREVTDLGLRHSLVTRWTAFVAVSEQIVNAAPGATADAALPLPPVAGITPRAYGSTANAFVGAAGPEASIWGGMLAVLLSACLLRRRRVAVRA